MNLKIMLLLFLLLFTSTFTIALITTSAAPNHLKTALLTYKSEGIQLTGGEPIDDPTAT